MQISNEWWQGFLTGVLASVVASVAAGVLMPILRLIYGNYLWCPLYKLWRFRRRHCGHWAYGCIQDPSSEQLICMRCYEAKFQGSEPSAHGG
jgi:hypothetical protein